MPSKGWRKEPQTEEAASVLWALGSFAAFSHLFLQSRLRSQRCGVALQKSNGKSEGDGGEELRIFGAPERRVFTAYCVGIRRNRVRIVRMVMRARETARRKSARMPWWRRRV